MSTMESSEAATVGRNLSTRYLAIAVEMAGSGEDAADISKPAYQEQVAQSIAAGIAAVRAKIPEVRP